MVYELLRQQLEKDVRHGFIPLLWGVRAGTAVIEKIRLNIRIATTALTLRVFWSWSAGGGRVCCALSVNYHVKKFLDVNESLRAYYPVRSGRTSGRTAARIPVHGISSGTAAGQVFFKWYGGAAERNNKPTICLCGRCSNISANGINISRWWGCRFDRAVRGGSICLWWSFRATMTFGEIQQWNG